MIKILATAFLLVVVTALTAVISWYLCLLWLKHVLDKIAERVTNELR